MGVILKGKRSRLCDTVGQILFTQDRSYKCFSREDSTLGVASLRMTEWGTGSLRMSTSEERLNLKVARIPKGHGVAMPFY